MGRPEASHLVGPRTDMDMRLYTMYINTVMFLMLWLPARHDIGLCQRAGPKLRAGPDPVLTDKSTHLIMDLVLIPGQSCDNYLCLRAGPKLRAWSDSVLTDK